MNTDLLSDKALSKLHGDTIRQAIDKKISNLKKEFRSVPIEMEVYNTGMADILRSEWKKDVNSVKGERAKKKLERLQILSKQYRLRALNEISKDWYNRLWSMRSEVALVSSIYDLSGLTSIPEFNSHWKPKSFSVFSPVVLRMNGPRKPKKNFVVKDIKYDIGAAYLRMMKPLEEWIRETQTHINKMVGVKKEQSEAIIIKRYRESILVREYLTVLCQAVSPRQSIVKRKK